MQRSVDVVVIGLGIMGAATAYHLARRGVRVVGLDAHGPGHARGSSHGDSRIYRRAYWEGGHYVPLLNRAYDGWRELDEQSSERVFVKTGGIFVGRASSTLVRQSRATAVEHAIAHELLDADEIRARFPAFRALEGVEALYEPDALMLFADAARAGFLAGAANAGAGLRYGEPALAVEPTPGGVEVVTAGGRIACQRVVVATGPWIAQLVAELRGVVRPMRTPVCWFEVDPDRERHFGVGALPVFLFEEDDGALIYGLPQRGDVRGGVKIAFHNRQLSEHEPTARARDVSAEEIAEVGARAERMFDGVARGRARGGTCVYTMTPDANFVLGRSGDRGEIVYASPCSGHGFKFAPVIGEALADLATGVTPAIDLRAFHVNRFVEKTTLGARPPFARGEMRTGGASGRGPRAQLRVTPA